MKLLLFFLLLVVSAWGQIDGTLHLSVNAPAAPTQVSLSLTGPQGPNSACYWVIARYPIGNAQPAQPACITNTPNILTAQNFITISWQPLQGATGYDVVRTPGQAIGSCTNCLVASNTQATSVVNNGALSSPYTLTTVGGASCIWYINNRDFSIPRVIEQCAFPFQLGGCLIFPDLTQQCSAQVPSVEWGAAVDLVPGTITMNSEVRQPITFHNADWNVSADVGALPTGQNAIIDIQISHDKGISWASIFPAGGANEINIVPGGPTSGTVTAFAIPSVGVGDLVKVVCVQAGNGGVAGKGIQGKLY